MISISGIVTFRAADNVREAALYVPNDRLLVETDSPFLAPVPMRGKQNEPAFITHTVKFISELRKTDAEILAALTFSNAESLLLK
jgi:TatD DNase family protein